MMYVYIMKQFVAGLAQVLFSMSVIEIAKPVKYRICLIFFSFPTSTFHPLPPFFIVFQGLEATTYELIITVSNAALTLSTVIATQLTFPLKIISCEESDPSSCSDDQVGALSQ